MRIRAQFRVVVSQIEVITPRVKRFTLSPVDSDSLLPFHPGAHIQTILPTPSGPLVRFYSLCSPADDSDYYQISILRSEPSRGGSRYWHDAVQVGQELKISAPINHLALSPTARRHVFVAGGIGITPFLPMLSELGRLEQPFELHYAASAPEECAFEAWLRRAFGSRVSFYFSSADRRLTPEFLRTMKVGTHLYVCGPDSLMRTFQTSARQVGFPQGSIHMEAFQAATVESAEPFQVVLKKSNRQLTVAADETLLLALRKSGVPVPSSCEVGGCGTCLLRVLDGEVMHRDFYLSETEQAENQQIISCVSRAQGSRITLDV